MTEDQAVDSVLAIIGNRYAEDTGKVEETPYYCSVCKKYFKSQDVMAADKSIKRGYKSLCLKCKATLERQRENSKKKNTITIDFSTIPNGLFLMEKILQAADDNVRTPAAQILYIIKNTIGKENA